MALEINRNTTAFRCTALDRTRPIKTAGRTKARTLETTPHR